MNNDPREYPLEFSDMSDYPQNGWGVMDVDRWPKREERDIEEEDIPLENYTLEDEE